MDINVRITNDSRQLHHDLMELYKTEDERVDCG